MTLVPSAGCPRWVRWPGPAAWRWAPAQAPWPAGWPAGRAGGRVVATDADPRFLAGTAVAGIEVRRHDILAGPLEPGRYDLVHCRALLCHLADPLRALRNMAGAVRPGGWLLVEDADYVSLVAADPAHPRSARFDAVMRKLLDIHRHITGVRPVLRPSACPRWSRPPAWPNEM